MSDLERSETEIDKADKQNAATSAHIGAAPAVPDRATIVAALQPARTAPGSSITYPLGKTLSSAKNRLATWLTAATMALGASTMGCNQVEKSSTQTNILPQGTENPLDAGQISKEPTTVPPPPLHPTSTANLTHEQWERLDSLEKLNPKNSMENSIKVYQKVLAADVSKGWKAHYINPFDPKIVGTFTMPPELCNDNSKQQKQDWHTAQRLKMAADPKYADTPIITDLKQELPIVSVQKPSSSLSTILKNANESTRIGNKEIPIITALEILIEKHFKTTNLGKFLNAKRYDQVKMALEKNAHDLRDLNVTTRDLLAQKPADLKQKLEEKSQERSRLTQERLDLAKELVHPTRYSDIFQSVAIGQVAQESTFKQDAKSNAAAVGIWQIQEGACHDVEKIKKNLHCSKQDLQDIEKSTQIAIAYLDIIFSRIREDVSALEKHFGITDPNEILIPAIFTSYIAGPDYVKRMIKGYMEDKKFLAMKEQIAKGEIAGADLFMLMITNAFKSDRATFGTASLSYYVKSVAWANLIYNTDIEIGEEENISEPESSAADLVPAPGQVPAPVPAVSASSLPPAASASAGRNLKTPAVPNAVKSPTQKSSGLKIFIPEEQLDFRSHLNIPASPVGNITITGGFMEPKGHSRKPNPQPAIFADGTLQNLPPANRNLGIDYKEERSQIRAWYGGTVEKIGLETGYGHRIHIKTDVTYKFNNVEYPVYQAYAHAKSFDANLKVGTKVNQFSQIGIMGGTGTGGKKQHPAHIDCRTYIMVNGKIVDLSLNALERQLVDGK